MAQTLSHTHDLLQSSYDRADTLTALLDTLTHTLSTTALDDATLTKDLLDCELLEHEVARLEAQRLAMRKEARARYTRAVLEGNAEAVRRQAEEAMAKGEAGWKVREGGGGSGVRGVVQ